LKKPAPKLRRQLRDLHASNLVFLPALIAEGEGDGVAVVRYFD
jgi:hypothetical protein